MRKSAILAAILMSTLMVGSASALSCGTNGLSFNGAIQLGCATHITNSGMSCGLFSGEYDYVCPADRLRCNYLCEDSHVYYTMHNLMGPSYACFECAGGGGPPLY